MSENWRRDTNGDVGWLDGEEEERKAGEREKMEIRSLKMGKTAWVN